MDSRVLTILLTDMKGFTETSSNRSRDEILSLVKEHDQLIRPVVEHFGGRVVKTIGDAFLVLFESPTNAVLAGLVIQHKLREHNAASPDDRKIEVRVAINVGEVQLTDNDVFGDAVNLTARINAITGAGEVYFTEGVYLAMKKKEVPSSEIGEHHFKGVPEAVKLFHVIQDPLSDQYRRALEDFRERETAIRAPAPGSPMPKRPRWLAIGGAAAILVAIAIVAVLLISRRDAWMKSARTFAGAGAFPEAWQLVDARFKSDPTDPKVRAVAAEILAKEVDSLMSRDGPQAVIDRLGQVRKERTYLTEVDDHLRRARRALGFKLAEKPGGDTYNEGLKILWQLVDEYPKDAGTVLDWLEAYDRGNWAWASNIVRTIDKALKRDERKAQDPRVKDRLLKILFEKQVSSTYEEAEILFDLTTKHYPDAVRTKLAGSVNDVQDPELRANAFGVMSRLGGVTPEQEFEFHRQNLFGLQGDHHKRAIEYFKPFQEGKKDAAPFVKGKAWDSIPNFDHSSAWETKNMMPLIQTLFFEGCQGFLKKGVVEPGQWDRRIDCFEVLEARNALTPEMQHRHYVLNLAEHEMDDLTYYYTIKDALTYLRAGRLQPEAWRTEAVGVLKQKLAEFAKARTNKQIRKNDDVVAWIEENLGAALKVQE